MRPHPHHQTYSSDRHPPTNHRAPNNNNNPPPRLALKTKTHHPKPPPLPPTKPSPLPPSQTALNDREAQLQDYLHARRETRGNGSPIHRNPQQVFTFSATDDVPVTTALDDFTEFVDPVPFPLPSFPPQEGEGGGGVAGGGTTEEDEDYYYRRQAVDRSHRRMVWALLGGRGEGPGGRDADVLGMMRMEQRVLAQGF